MSVEGLEDRFYRSKPGWRDGTAEFHDILVSLIGMRGGDVLEIGPGPENATSRMLASLARRLDGLDVDERARCNSAFKQVFIYPGREIPMESERYDVVVADYVMEHVQHPQTTLNEIHRILRTGGVFAFRTPNLLHYTTMVSRFSPHSLHVKTANLARKRPAGSMEPYPTFYKFNLPHTVQRLATSSGLRVIELRMVEKQPSYLQFSSLAYRVGVMYERLVNATPVLAGVRSNIFGILEKRA